MLKIGEFSKLSRVSVRMLRYYDAIGLLKPLILAHGALPSRSQSDSPSALSSFPSHFRKPSAPARQPKAPASSSAA